MKKSSLSKLTLLLMTASLCVSTAAWAKTRTSKKKSSVAQDLDRLGGNKELLRKARSLDPKNKIRIVQNRLVDRNMRLEVGATYGFSFGGDPYVNTDSLGVQADLHFSPRWSLGARYYSHGNSFTSEGLQRIDNLNGVRPATDAPIDSALGVVNWYPIYGKLNFFDLATAQYDLYAIVGAGQMQLASGSTPTYTFGGGMGVWFSQSIASRIELRYQSYTDEPIANQTRDVDWTVLSFTLSYLL